MKTEKMTENVLDIDETGVNGKNLEIEENLIVGGALSLNSNCLPQLPLKERTKTRSDSLRLKEDGKKDCIRTYWMSIENNECFNEDMMVVTMEIPRKEQRILEVIEAKKKEVDILERYGTLEEVKDKGKEKNH